MPNTPVSHGIHTLLQGLGLLAGEDRPVPGLGARLEPLAGRGALRRVLGPRGDSGTFGRRATARSVWGGGGGERGRCADREGEGGGDLALGAPWVGLGEGKRCQGAPWLLHQCRSVQRSRARVSAGVCMCVRVCVHVCVCMHVRVDMCVHTVCLQPEGRWCQELSLHSRQLSPLGVPPAQPVTPQAHPTPGAPITTPRLTLCQRVPLRSPLRHQPQVAGQDPQHPVDGGNLGRGRGAELGWGVLACAEVGAIEGDIAKAHPQGVLP